MPNPDKTYACKACDGGRVRVEAPNCPSCDEPVAAEDRYCEHCGAGLDAAPSPSSSPRPGSNPTARPTRPTAGGRRGGRRRSGGAAGARRRQASGDLARAMKLVRTLRVFYVINAVFHGLAVLGLVLAFAADLSEVGLLVAMLVSQALLTATMVAGIFLVVHQPAIWAVVMACLVTLSRLISAWSSDWSVLVTLLGGLWALAFWALVGPAARAGRLMQEHPDLPTVTRLERARPRAVRRATIGAAAALLLAFVPAWMIHNENATPPFDPVWEEFVADWSRGPSAVARWVETADGEEAARGFRDQVRALDWDRLPALDAVVTVVEMDPFGNADEARVTRAHHVRKRLDLDEDGQAVHFVWNYRGDEWLLTDLALPNPPFPEALVERLAIAWTSGNIGLLVDTSARPELFERRVQRTMQSRGWEELPEIRDAAALYEPSQTIIELETEEGVVRLNFGCRDGTWRLSTIQWP